GLGGDDLELELELDADADAESDGDHAWMEMLAWLGVGRAPLMVLLTVGLLAFGITGLLLRPLVGPIVALLVALVAAPLAYLAMDRWLDAFAYRVGIGLDVFLLAGAVTLGVALATVSVHALRAATGDPVRALRCE
ncbi:MAG: DUF1449 family protein, partial [Rhodothermales bacterium]|nr:DUF1449 family protein [Rhodothermales bacterium]